jgi:hypothetical protein
LIPKRWDGNVKPVFLEMLKSASFFVVAMGIFSSDRESCRHFSTERNHLTSFVLARKLHDLPREGNANDAAQGSPEAATFSARFGSNHLAECHRGV